MNYSKKYVEITEKTGPEEIYALVDDEETDLDENVANEMNDSDTGLFENDELDSSGFCSDLGH